MIEIPLTKGYVAVVDDIDADLAEFKWFAYQEGYAGRNVGARGNQKRILLHIVILERLICRQLTKDEYADHKDTNPCNCRRENIRLATMAQNNQNRGISTRNKSGFKGVAWHKRGKCWAATIRTNNESKWLGGFDNAIDAHRAYCKKALELHGTFANFGDNSPFRGWTLTDFEKQGQ